MADRSGMARLRLLLWSCALVLSFGMLGLLIAVFSRLRRGRSGRGMTCVSCGRLRYVQQAAVALVAICVLAGTVARMGLVSEPAPRCGRAWFSSSETPSPSPPRPQLSLPWRITRSAVTAPITGVAYVFAAIRGMKLCDVGGMTVAYVPHASGDQAAGATVGDMFLTRVGSGLSSDRVQALARHESRHVDQWTVLTLAGGPLALPVLYGLDETFFPRSRNHFERQAGLASGGYEQPGGFGPEPQWVRVAVLVMAVGLLVRRRLRWLSRVAVQGHPGTLRSEPGRCPLHSRGWLDAHP